LGDSPLDQGIFDVVQGRVDQNAGVIPCSRLDPDSLVDERSLTQALVGDGDGYDSQGVL
jgi:hypothetical protein